MGSLSNPSGNSPLSIPNCVVTPRCRFANSSRTSPKAHVPVHAKVTKTSMKRIAKWIMSSIPCHTDEDEIPKSEHHNMESSNPMHANVMAIEGGIHNQLTLMSVAMSTPTRGWALVVWTTCKYKHRNFQPSSNGTLSHHVRNDQTKCFDLSRESFVRGGPRHSHQTLH